MIARSSQRSSPLAISDSCHNAFYAFVISLARLAAEPVLEELHERGAFLVPSQTMPRCNVRPCFYRRLIRKAVDNSFGGIRIVLGQSVKQDVMGRG